MIGRLAGACLGGEYRKGRSPAERSAVAGPAQTRLLSLEVYSA